MQPAIACGLAVALVAAAAVPQGPKPGITQDWSKIEHRIAWHGTWKGAVAAAELTGRPILVVSAAPHCGLVPGMW